MRLPLDLALAAVLISIAALAVADEQSEDTPKKTSESEKDNEVLLDRTTDNPRHGRISERGISRGCSVGHPGRT